LLAPVVIFGAGIVRYTQDGAPNGAFFYLAAFSLAASRSRRRTLDQLIDCADVVDRQEGPVINCEQFFRRLPFLTLCRHLPFRHASQAHASEEISEPGEFNDLFSR